MILKIKNGMILSLLVLIPLVGCSQSNETSKLVESKTGEWKDRWERVYFSYSAEMIEYNLFPLVIDLYKRGYRVKSTYLKNEPDQYGFYYVDINFNTHEDYEYPEVDLTIPETKPITVESEKRIVFYLTPYQSKGAWDAYQKMEDLVKEGHHIINIEEKVIDPQENNRPFVYQYIITYEAPKGWKKNWSEEDMKIYKQAPPLKWY